MYYKKVFKVPLYPFWYAIVVTDEVKKLKKLPIEERDTSDMNTEDSIYATTFRDAHEERPDGRKYHCPHIVLNFRNGYSRMTRGVVAHELVHLRSILFKELGIKVNLKNDEPEAYVMGDITDTVLNYLEEVIEKENALYNSIDRPGLPKIKFYKNEYEDIVYEKTV